MNFRYSMRILATLLTAAAILAVPSQSQAQLNFNVTSSGNMLADNAFQTAADIWSMEFGDDITVNLDIGFQDIGGAIANSTSASQLTTFAGFVSAVGDNVTTADDQSYFSTLPTGTSFSVYINRTTEASGADFEVPYVDDDGGLNNSTIRLTTANAKALGLRAGNDSLLDASIIFNDSFAFDFDRSDGIEAGAIDFIGVALHEIGHALGFESGVDFLDINGDGLSNDDEFDSVSSIDFLRFSNDSEAAGADIDWTADDRNKYFSIDGGATKLAAGDAHWSTGAEFGDGEQASHWKSGANIGLLAPTTTSGAIGNLSNLDLRAFDVIGYDRIASVPEPGSAMLLSLIGFGLLSRRRR